jgi:hypothetical protein
MYVFARGINFASLYDFSVGFWEKFRQRGIFGFSYYWTPLWDVFLFIHNFPMTFHISKHGHNSHYTFICVLPSLLNRMDGVIVSVLASSAVDCWF